MPFSSGNTYYVDLFGTGSDSRTTTQAQVRTTPWATVGHAIASVSSGSTIMCINTGNVNAPGGGVGALDVRSVTFSTSNPVTIKCETQYGIVLTSSGGPNGGGTGPFVQSLVVYLATGIRIDGFQVSARGLDSGGTGGGSTGCQIEDSQRIEVTRCKFTNNGGSAYQTRGGTGRASGDLWCIGNIFIPTSGAPSNLGCGIDASTTLPSDEPGYFSKHGTHYIYMGQDNGSGGTLSGTVREVVANNIFSGTAPGYCVQAGPQVDTGYIVSNTMYNNRAADHNAGDGITPFDNGGPTYLTRNTTMKNNIITTCTGSAIFGTAGGPEVGNLVETNLAFNNDCLGAADNGWPAHTDYPPKVSPSGSLIYTIGPNGNRTNADPKFNSPTTGDFTLQSSSPAIGVADIAFSPLTDYNEHARSPTRPVTRRAGACRGRGVAGGVDRASSPSADSRTLYLMSGFGPSVTLVAPLNISTAAYANALIVKPGPGILYGFSVYNSKASTQFIQLFDSATIPADTAVPVFVGTMATVANFVQGFGERGKAFANGIVIANSSTGPAKTIGSADCFIECAVRVTGCRLSA